MGASNYRFVSRWRVAGTVEEITAVFDEPGDLPRWWPAVYLEAEQTAAGDAGGIGKEFRLLTKGWLPYRLQWTFRVAESRAPLGYTLEASGDFVGLGVWTFRQDGDHAEVVYQWSIRAEKPLLRYLSLLLRPVFAANHRWAMATGETSLRLELERRRAGLGEGRQRVGAPPGPTTYEPYAALGAMLALVWWLLR